MALGRTGAEEDVDGRFFGGRPILPFGFAGFAALGVVDFDLMFSAVFFGVLELVPARLETAEAGAVGTGLKDEEFDEGG